LAGLGFWAGTGVVPGEIVVGRGGLSISSVLFVAVLDLSWN
jgi:hypothetical protein